MHTAYEKIVKATRFRHVTKQDFNQWFVDNKHKVKEFETFVRTLRQARLVRDEDAKAWLWSFYNDPIVKEFSTDEQKRYYMGATSGLARLSAYDAAVVAQELESPGGTNFAFKSAESIRRNMLLRDLFSGIKPRPETRLRAFARDAMLKAAWKEFYQHNRNKPDFLYAEIAKPAANEWMSAYGKRYAFLKAQYEEQTLYAPVLLVADDDTTKEQEYLYELAALQSVLPEDVVTGPCIIATVHPENFAIHTRLVHDVPIKTVRALVEQFWRENVLDDKSIGWQTREKRMAMDAETRNIFLAEADRLSRLCLQRKILEDQEKTSRKALLNIVTSFAKAQGLDPCDIDTPDGIISARRSATVLPDSLQFIVDRMPEAEQRVFKEFKPDPDLMQAKLRELGVDPREWCAGVPDAKKVLAFCEEYGMRAPVEYKLSFAMRQSKKAQEQMEALKKETERSMRM